MERKTPKIRETTADTVSGRRSKEKHPFMFPEWTPGVEGDFGTALSRIFADMAENLASQPERCPQETSLFFSRYAELLPQSCQTGKDGTLLCPGSRSSGKCNNSGQDPYHSQRPGRRKYFL